MEKAHRYNLKDGRILLSNTSLKYAMGANGNIDLTKLTPEDFSKISIIADPQLENLLRFTDRITHPNSPATGGGLPSELTYCIMDEGQILIHDGEYKALSDFLQNASKQELGYAFSKVALQAALSHQKLARLTPTEVSA